MTPAQRAELDAAIAESGRGEVVDPTTLDAPSAKNQGWLEILAAGGNNRNVREVNALSGSGAP